MNLQKKTINRYRQLFPNETLRETSAKTGIQITRVFRLFTGRPMKVGELEAFEKAIAERMKENPHHARVTEILEKSSFMLTNEELEKIIEWIERKIVAKAYGRFYVGQKRDDKQIA